MALIYIVEDDENIREIEMFALKNAGYEVQGFDCASAFYARLKEKVPALALLDIMLPDEDGLSMVKRLRAAAETRRLPIIMATAKTTEIDKVKGLDIGADDYITKPFGVMELISRVKALLRRSRGMEEERLIRLGPIFMDDERRAVFAGDRPCELTYKEYELLKLLLLNAGIVASRDVILDRVWGTDFEGESRTLDMHIKTLRQKLGDAGAMIRTVRNVGYMLTGDGMDGNIGLTGTSADVYLVLDGGTTGRAHEVTVGENSEALENSQAVVVDEDTKLTLKFGKDTTDTDVTLNNLVGLEGSTLEVTDGRSKPEEGELEHVTVDLNNATADITDETGYGDGAVNDEEGHTVTTDGTDGFGVKGQDTTFEGTIKSSKDTVDFTKSGDGQLTLGSATTKKGGINVAGDLKLADGGITLQGGSSNKLGSLTFGYNEQTPGESTVDNTGLTLTNEADITVKDIVEAGTDMNGNGGQGGDVTLGKGSEFKLDNSGNGGNTTLHDTTFRAGADKDEDGNVVGGKLVVGGKTEVKDEEGKGAGTYTGSGLTLDGKDAGVNGVDLAVKDGADMAMKNGATVKDSDVTVSGNRTTKPAVKDENGEVVEEAETAGSTLTLGDGASITGDSNITVEKEGKVTLEELSAGAAEGTKGAELNIDGDLTLKEGGSLTLNDSDNQVGGLTGKGTLEGGAGDSLTVTDTDEGGSIFSGTLAGKSNAEGKLEGGAKLAVGEGGKLTLDHVTTDAGSKWNLDIAGSNPDSGAKGGVLELNSSEVKKDDETETQIVMDFGDITLNAGGTLSLKGDKTTGNVKVGSALEDGTKGQLFVDITGTKPEQGVSLGGLKFMDENGKDLTDPEKALSVGLSGLGAAHYTGGELELRTNEDGTTQWYISMTPQPENTYLKSGMHKNVRAGANMIWEATDPYSSTYAYVTSEAGAKGDLVNVLNALDTYQNPSSLAMLQMLNPAMYEIIANMDVQRVYAAVAGSSVATLGSASVQDVKRQLESVRNRAAMPGGANVNADPGAKALHAWINAESGYNKVDADGWAPGYTLNGWGGSLGGSMEISSDTTVGLALTAMYNDLKTDSADSGRGDIDLTYLSGFVRAQSGSWSHTFVATVGLADVSLDRTVGYGTGTYKAHGETDGYAAGFMYEVSYTTMLDEKGSMAFQPLFNVQYRHSQINGYNETGSDAGLRVDEATADVVTFGLGARLQTAIHGNVFGRSSVFETRVLAKADAGDNVGKANTSLLHGIRSQEVESAGIGKLGVEVGAGLTLPVGSNGGTFFIDASAEFRAHYTNLNASAGYRISF